MVGSSLAWWTWSTSSNEQTNVVVTVGGITIDYEDGENITNNNLIPTSTKEKVLVRILPLVVRDKYI